MGTAIFSYKLHITDKYLIVVLNEVEVQLKRFCNAFLVPVLKKGLTNLAYNFLEMLILVTNLDVSKRPCPCHALGRSVCLSQGCGRLYTCVEKRSVSVKEKINFATESLVLHT